jgi:hypothetical protein
MDRKQTASPSEQKPIMIWFAAIYLTASSLLPFLPLITDESAYNAFLTQSTFQFMLIIPIPTFNILGTLLMLMMRKESFYILLISLVFSILSTLYILGFTNFIDQTGNIFLVILKTVISWCICVSILTYVRYLTKKGLLK